MTREMGTLKLTFNVEVKMSQRNEELLLDSNFLLWQSLPYLHLKYSGGYAAGSHLYHLFKIYKINVNLYEILMLLTMSTQVNLRLLPGGNEQVVKI